ncbi:hypothetical protein GRS83_10545 [Rathayibacter rathayi NCPPB 2980 = VKM Ac-1601]|nr:hypothetical protein [Rathayibacter rathayi NCPPB 2980 = VKM Ac-1601]
MRSSLNASGCSPARSETSTIENIVRSVNRQPFFPDAEALGRCACCAAPTSRMRNCTQPSCRAQLVVCADCEATVCAAHAGSTLVP